MPIVDANMPLAPQFPAESNQTELDIDQLMKEVVSSLSSLKNKNKELEARNADLLASIQQAQAEARRTGELEKRNTELENALRNAEDRIVKLEHAAQLSFQLTNKAIKTATDALKQIQETIELEQPAGLFVTEQTAQTASYDQRSSEEVSETQPKESRKSIFSMAEEHSSFYLSDSSEPTPANGVESKITSAEQPVETALEQNSYAQATAHETTVEDSVAPAESDSSPIPPTPGAMLDGLHELTEQLSKLTEPPAPSLPNGGSQPFVPQSSTSETLPGTFELVASPFRSFASLSAFQRALQQIPGVIEASAHGFDNGTLRATMKYSGTIPLQSRLLALPHFNLQLISVSEHHIEVIVSESSD